MTDLARLLQKKVEDITADLEGAKKAAASANARAAELSKRLDSFRAALNVEVGEDAVSFTFEPPEESPEAGNGVQDNKSQIARDLIRANASKGITPKDLSGAFKKSGVNFHPNYTYAVLRRLKKNKTIRESGGRYYPAS